MAVKLRERPGKGWYVLTDWKGQRKAKFFGKNKALAKDFKEKLEAKLKLGSAGIATRAGVKLDTYAETWLERIKHTRKPSTYDDYQKMWKREIQPALGGLDLEDIMRDKVKALAFGALKKGLSPKTVQNLIRCLSSMLSHAVEDGLLTGESGVKAWQVFAENQQATEHQSADPRRGEDLLGNHQGEGIRILSHLAHSVSCRPASRGTGGART
jgi:hypothetical protein